MPKAYQAILAIKQASESKNGWFSKLEAELLKIQGSKQKIGKTQVFKLIVDAIPYNFPWFILVIKANFWASNIRPLLLTWQIFWD